MKSSSNTPPKPWPSREEWAIEIRTYYGDYRVPVSNRVRDYASTDEIAAAVEELRSKIKVLDAQAREAKKAIGDLAKRPGETSRNYSPRWVAMTDEEQAKVKAWDRPRGDAQDLRRIIRDLAANDLPTAYCEGLKAAAFGERYQRAVSAYHDEQRRVYAERPIDDVEWERELQRRRETDQRFDR